MTVYSRPIRPVDTSPVFTPTRRASSTPNSGTIPRLSSAHNHSAPWLLAVYRFLGAVQQQGVATGFEFSWDGLAGATSFAVPIAGMAGALVQALREPAPLEVMARHGRQTVREHYEWSALANKLEQVWESAVVRAAARTPVAV